MSERPLFMFNSDRYSPKYVGGHSSKQGPIRGHFIITTERVGIGKVSPFGGKLTWLAACPVDAIASVEVGGPGQVAKSKALAVVAFGVFGLGAKGSMRQSDVVVHMKDGEMAYFTIDAAPPLVRASFTPAMQELSLPLLGG